MKKQTHTTHRVQKPVRHAHARSANHVLAWIAPSAPQFERTPRWYAIAGVLVLMIAVYGILTRDWSLTLLVLLIGGMYYLVRDASPVLHQISIEHDGFFYDDVFTHWSDCKEFWLIKTRTYSQLHIWRKKGNPHDIVILTGNIGDSEIISTISQKLQFNPDRREHLFDMFIRLCKL